MECARFVQALDSTNWKPEPFFYEVLVECESGL